MRRSRLAVQESAARRGQRLDEVHFSMARLLLRLEFTVDAVCKIGRAHV
jgi:hypothetical protein